MKRDRPWSIILIAIASIVAVALILSLMPSDKAVYSSESTKKNGTKALYRLLEVRGIAVGRLNGGDPLPKGKDHVLHIIAPDYAWKHEKEITQLKAWVKEGNTVVFWVPPGHPLLGEFGFSGRWGAMKEEKVRVKPSPTLWLKEIDTLAFSGSHRVGEDAEALLEDESGAVLVGQKEMGAGKIFYVPDPNLITNVYIDKQDNLALPLYFASLGDQGVWFDEGILLSRPLASQMEEKVPTLGGLLAPMRFVLLEVLLLSVLWLYMKGKRFAAPRWESVSQVRSGDEYVVAMAGLYRSARLKSEVLRIQVHFFRKKIARTLGLPVDVSDEGLIETIQQTAGVETAEKAKQVLHAKDRPLNSKTLIKLSRQMEEVREEIDKWKANR